MQSAQTQPQSDKDRFCKSIINPAADARAARLQRALEAAEQQLAKRIAELEAKRAELADWVAKRESFLQSVGPKVIDIYTLMKPDAAAQQLSLLDNSQATAILMRLKPRTSSAILNEMQTQRASELAKLMSGTANLKPGTCS